MHLSAVGGCIPAFWPGKDETMKTVQLALCLALVGGAFLPTASACCIHTTRQLAWAEYAVTPEGVVCAVVSSPGPLQQGGCTLAVEGSSFQLAVVDGAAPSVSLSWEACGASGAGSGSVFVDVPEGCEVARITLGPEAVAGVLRQAIV